MKKIIIISIFGTIFFASCNSDEENLDFKKENAIIENAISSDSLFSIGNEKFATWSSNSNATAVTRSSITPFTVYGYSSYTSTGNRNVRITKDLADKMGIYRQIYIMETLTVYYDLTISGLNTTNYFAYADSPNCGIDPNNSSNIGYSHSQSGTNVKLATKLHHIISDLSGRPYDAWYPCKPAELQWNYSLIIL